MDELSHALARWTTIFYIERYLRYILEKHTGAVYVPRIWVESRHAERRLAIALWQLDGVLITRTFVEMFGGIEVDDVDLSWL